MRAGLAAVMLLAAGCAPVEPPPTLPPSIGPQAGFVSRDPIMVVGQDVTAFFRAPRAGQPAAAARAIAELEWLADAVPANPRWQTASGTAIVALAQSRWEARTALGIPSNTPAQAVINGLAGAAVAIEAGDRAALAAALPRAVFPLGPEGTVRRLSQPPSVPSAMLALAALSRGPDASAMNPNRR